MIFVINKSLNNKKRAGGETALLGVLFKPMGPLGPVMHKNNKCIIEKALTTKGSKKFR